MTTTTRYKTFRGFLNDHLAGNYTIGVVDSEPLNGGLLVKFNADPLKPGTRREVFVAFVLNDSGDWMNPRWRMVWCHVARDVK